MAMTQKEIDATAAREAAQPEIELRKTALVLANNTIEPLESVVKRAEAYLAFLRGSSAP